MEKSTIRKPTITVFYNGKNITADISKYLLSLTYTDYEKEQSDELNIELKDNKKLFQGDWKPQKGDKISAKIGYNTNEKLDCGTFTIDEVELRMSDNGDVVSIKALAASINQQIRTKNSKSYKNKTLVEIAKEIAKKYGYSVVGSTGNVKIGYIAQIDESDLSFLSRIAKKYGYLFKLTDNLITFTPVEKTTDPKGIKDVVKKEISSLSLRDNGVRHYGKCAVQYLDKSGKYISYIASANNSSKEILKLDTKCKSKSEAIQLANAGLKNGSKKIEGNIEFKDGQISMIAGVNINLKLDNAYDNKYHIKQSTHNVSDGTYTTSVEVETCS